MDCGQPIRFMKQAAVRGAANFRFFADKSPEAQNGLALHQDQHTNYTIRTPIGPVGIITPWNTPFMLSTWKIAPALAAGCTVVHKPAELSPLSAMLLAEISQEAGIPAGVWNTVNGFGQVAGKRLTEHPAIKAVSLVGDSATGRHIMRQGADTLKRVHFELGGKNPVIVFDDADFDRALDAVVFMIYSLNGQRCTSSSRLLIQSGIRDKFIAALEERVKALRVGHSLDPATEVGPLIHTGHFNKVMSYMDAAKEDGATTAVGGVRREDLGPGNYVSPTLFTNANNSMRIAREEIFGPVLVVIPFEDDEDAIRIANDSSYGLGGAVVSGDRDRALHVARSVRAGSISVNDGMSITGDLPFGGVKGSGVGREWGREGIEEFLDSKAIAIGVS
jgi:5-carboxymethyl-2-hydroxymuconic-semialdehyde dehydrogenase